MGKEAKTNAMRILEREKIPYTAHAYECREFTDGLAVARSLGQDPARTFKTLVAEGKSGAHFVFVLPVAAELDLKRAAKSVGEKSVSLVPVKEIEGLTGYVRGGCTAVGMKKQFVTRIHESAKEFDTIFVSAGRLGLQLELRPHDLLRAARAEYVGLVV